VTVDEARRQRGDRLKAARARARKVGCRVEASAGGFTLLRAGEALSGAEIGLADIDAALAELEARPKPPTGRVKPSRRDVDHRETTMHLNERGQRETAISLRDALERRP
jgi:hypothetical protein